jgi:hypothetical protein
VRLEIRGGASPIALDAQRLGAVGGDTVLESGEVEKQGGRYEVSVSGGASDVAVDRA